MGRIERTRRFGALSVTAAGIALALAGAATARTDASTQAAAAKAKKPGNYACVKTTGITKKTITIGELIGTSGPFGAVGQRINRGFDAYIAAINKKGGIGGRQIVVQKLDHEYNPATAVQRFHDLEPRVAMLVSHGTQPTNAILPEIAGACMPTVIMGQGGVNALSPYTTVYGTPYAYNAVNGMEWAVTKKGARGKWGIIYQSDVVGDELRRATQFTANFLKVNLASEVSFNVGDRDFSAQIQKLRQADVEWVMLASFSPTAVQIVSQAVALGARFKWIAPGVGWNGELDFGTPAAKLLDSLEFYESTYYSGWNGGGKYGREARRLIGPDNPGILPLLGYSAGVVVVKNLDRATKARKLNRGGIVASIAQTGTVDMEPLFCKYTFGEKGQANNPSRGVMIHKISTAKAPDGYDTVQSCFVGRAAKAFALARLK